MDTYPRERPQGSDGVMGMDRAVAGSLQALARSRTHGFAARPRGDLRREPVVPACFLLRAIPASGPAPETETEEGCPAVASTLLKDLRERRVVQWMIGYLAGAWFLLQGMDILGEIWNWSLLLQQVVSLSLGLGVLPAFVLAWYHGEQGRQRVTATEATLLAATIMSLVVTVWCVCFSSVMGPA